MIDLGNLKIGIEVDDKQAKDQLSNLGEAAGKTDGKFGKFKAGLKKVAVGVGAVTAASVVAFKAFKSLTDKVAKYGDEIDKNSQKMGISAEAYQKWDYVLKRNGSSIQALKTGMKTFTAQIEAGNKTFDKLGVSVKNTDGTFRDTTEVLNESIVALAKVEDQTERTTMANELFGKRTAQELLPTLNSGADGIQNLQKRAEELGFVMSDETVKACADYEDAMLDVQMATTGLRNNIMAGVIPVMGQLASKLSDGIGHISTTLHKEIEKNGAKGIFTALGKLIGEAGNKLAEMAPKLLKGAIKLATEFGNYLAEAIPKALKKLAGLGDKIADAIGGGGSGKLASKAFDIIKTFFEGMIKAVPKLIKSLSKIVSSIADSLGTGKGGKMIKAGMKLILDLGVGIVKALPQLLLAIGKLALALVKQIPKLFISLGSTIVSAIADGIKGSIDSLGSLLSKGIDFVLNLKPIELAQAALEKLASVWDAVKKAFKKAGQFVLKYNAINLAKKAIDVLKNAWDKIKSAAKKAASFAAKYGPLQSAKKVIDTLKTAWEKIKEAAKKAASFTVKAPGINKIISAFQSLKNWWDKIKKGGKANYTVNKNGSKRIGLREVPFDGYIAELHKGEAILTAAETNLYRKWIDQQAEQKQQATQPTVVQAMDIDYNKLAKTMLDALTGININTAVNVDGKTLAQSTAPFMRTEINTIDRRMNRTYGIV